MAGVVSDYLRALLAKQADEHGLVVWFDPAGDYRALAATLELPGAAVARYEGSFLALRRRIEPAVAPTRPDQSWRERPDPVVAYLPLAPEDTADALIDLTSMGIVLAPGQSPWQRNTRLDVVARQALRNTLPPAQLDAIIEQTRRGQLSLADLDRLAEQGSGGQYPGLALTFGTADPKTIALEFLTSARHDADLVARAAVDQLVTLLARAFDLAISGEAAADLGTLRAAFGRYALLADLLVGLGEHTPASLRDVPVPRGDARKALLGIVRTWRNDRDFAESYELAADQVERALGSDLFGEIPLAGLRGVETFAGTELALQAASARALRSGRVADLVAEAERRDGGFWASRRPRFAARWRMIADAGRLLVLAGEVGRELKRKQLNAEALFTTYVEGERPWCLLDTHHRHLLARYHQLDHELEREHGGAELQMLAVHARNRYAAVVADLAETFSDAYQRAGFQLRHQLAQGDLFAQRVRPALGQKGVAYVLVDALRFEMARELVSWQPREWQVQLEPAVATFPTITQVGMAALMPGAEKGLALKDQAHQLVVEAGAAVVNTRAERIKLLDGVFPAGWLAVKLEDLIPIAPGLRKKLEAAPAVLVTSQEIDELGEGGPTVMARRVMETVLHDLLRAFGALQAVGFQRIVVAADHGFLFGEDVSEGEKIEAPGGQTVELHRRVWIGRGGSSEPAVIRLTAADTGLGGDLEFATPRGSGVFKQAGGLSYFHGGLSLQELAIPVISLTSIKSVAAGAGARLEWEVVLGSKTISTRFFSATLRATTPELFPIEAPRVAVDLRQGAQRIGSAVSAGYGYQPSGIVELRVRPENPRELEPNTIMFELVDGMLEGTASLVVADAATGRELTRLDGIPISMAF